MRNRRVNLLDIGLDTSFDASMTFVQSTLQNINAGWDQPIVDIDFVRSRDLGTVLAAFTAPCDVLHVMAHGDQTETPTFSSSDGITAVAMEKLGLLAVDQGKGIRTGAVLADGCKTGTRRVADRGARLPAGRCHVYRHFGAGGLARGHGLLLGFLRRAVSQQGQGDDLRRTGGRRGLPGDPGVYGDHRQDLPVQGENPETEQLGAPSLHLGLTEEKEILSNS